MGTEPFTDDHLAMLDRIVQAISEDGLTVLGDPWEGYTVHQSITVGGEERNPAEVILVAAPGGGD